MNPVEALAAVSPGPAGWAMFAAATFVLNATPGVDLLLVSSRTLARGWRAGLASAAGISVGCLVHAALAASGLAALLALHPGAFRVVQLGGAAYLAWLGAGMLWRAWQGGPPAPPGRPGPPAAADRRAATLGAEFRTGLLTNVLNPKVALFFVAFLPPFVPAGTPSQAASLALLGGAFFAQSALFLAAWVGLLGLAGVAAGRRGWQTSPALARALGGTGGLLFLLLAWRLTGARPAA